MFSFFLMQLCIMFDTDNNLPKTGDACFLKFFFSGNNRVIYWTTQCPTRFSVVSIHKCDLVSLKISGHIKGDVSYLIRRH